MKTAATLIIFALAIYSIGAAMYYVGMLSADMRPERRAFRVGLSALFKFLFYKAIFLLCFWALGRMMPVTRPCIQILFLCAPLRPSQQVPPHFKHLVVPQPATPTPQRP
jgi:hypothetical protein